MRVLFEHCCFIVDRPIGQYTHLAGERQVYEEKNTEQNCEHSPVLPGQRSGAHLPSAAKT
jgi:hypothetical protein